MKLSLLSLSLFFCLFLSLIIHVKGSNINKDNFVSLSLIMDTPSGAWSETYYTKLCSFLSSVNYTDWTFCIWDTANGFETWIDNATRLNKLKEYGVLIPRLSYMQLKDPQDRISYVDAVFTNWSSKVGYYPKGIFDFIPDTFTANYVYSEYDSVFYQGYCFDQYRIDYMSMRGAWQLPYYADMGNILVPRPSGKGIIVLPHNIWDWYSSFTVDHHLTSHIPTLLKYMYDGKSGIAEKYWLSLIEQNAEASSPFSYATIQLEWVWLCQYWGYEDEAENWIKDLLNEDYTFLTFEDVAQWFRLHYAENPSYRVEFQSPYEGDKITWFWNTQRRYAQVGTDILSYVDYTTQEVDKYVNSKETINWGLTGTPCAPDNQIDISLTFNIDNLGGGYLRSPVNTPSFMTGQFVGVMGIVLLATVILGVVYIAKRTWF